MADALTQLLTPEGWTLLNSTEPFAESEALRINEQLRKAGHSPELVSAVLAQVQLRAKASVKFGEFAQSMLFTPAGLEQATRLSVAAAHAQRFIRAGVETVADLGCGLGADSLAFSAAGLEVTAVELDETTAAAATINLMPFPQSRVIHGSAESFDTGLVQGIWLDPARRNTSTSGTSRLFDPEAFSPPLSFVEGLADGGKAVGVKLGPGIPHESIPPTAEAQWVSVSGDLVEVSLWFNSLARPGVRRAALVMKDDGAHELTSPLAYAPNEQEPPLGELSGYLYEPDSAIIRSGLVADLARLTGMHLIDPLIAYLSTPEPVETPFARGYKILDVLPFNMKVLKNWVRGNGISTLEIKKRGASVTPEELRQQLLGGGKSKSNRGPNAATLVLTRIGNERVAAVVEVLK